MGRKVAIVGGGFSGAMLAARLAERGVDSILVERTGTFGLGAAYSTVADEHLLNVRSNRMSAVDGRPDDFVRWLETHHPRHADPQGFSPRRLYGLYVQDRLAAAEAANPGRIERVTGEAEAIEASAVRLRDGRVARADIVVLATGNPVPMMAGTTRSVVSDPWAPGVLDAIGEGDDVIVLGAGLSMVDVILSLEARGWRGRAVALSRRGLKPRAHAARHDAPITPTRALTTGPLSLRLAEGRRLARANGWRGVMEGLRPVTGDLWAQADSVTRGRFLRHLRPWWDVHRHRIADGVAATITRLEAEGRLTIVAGRIGQLRRDGASIAVDWRQRGGGERTPLTGRWVIDCTGPGHDAANDTLTASLLATGRARMDASGLGLDLDVRSRVRNSDGTPMPGLFVLGPPARAAFWESVAVPDIRRQIERLTDEIVAQAGAIT